MILLFCSIWKYLVEITRKDNKAVIITTHYIEEARQADRVSSIENWENLVFILIALT